MKKLIILTSMFLVTSAFAVQVRICDISPRNETNIVELSNTNLMNLPKVI